MTIDEINRLPMVFIMGFPRSGTTLLRYILDAGGETQFAPEGKIIIHLKQKYKHRQNWSPSVLDEFVNDLFEEKTFARTWNIDRHSLSEKLHALPIERITFTLLLKVVYLEYPSIFVKGKIRIIGDKNPGYAPFILELLEVFPDARIIHLIRDYRDCILSNKNALMRKKVLNTAIQWRMHNEIIGSVGKSMGKRYMKVNYEDLVKDSENKVMDICHFLQLDFKPGMLDFHHTVNEKEDFNHDQFYEKAHRNLGEEINTSKIGTGKEGLSLEERKRIAFVLNEYGKKHGYEADVEWKGEKFRLAMAMELISILLNKWITKTYYLLSFPLRNTIRYGAQWLFNKFGIYTVHNEEDNVNMIYKTKAAQND